MRKLELHYQILIAMVLGTVLGLGLHQLAAADVVSEEVPNRAALLGKELGGVFLQLLKMVVVPLIATSLVSGVTSMGDVTHLGRLGGRTLLFYLVSSMLAIITGLLVVNLLNPGAGADLSALKAMVPNSEAPPHVAEGDTSIWSMLWQQLTRMIPDNPIAAAAEGDMLPIIFFSILFGIFLTQLSSSEAQRVKESISVAFEVMMRMTIALVHLAPLGVFGYMVFATAAQGLAVFGLLAKYMLTVALGLFIHAFITLPLLLRLFARRSALEFAKAMSPALLTAFSTASSNATLPLTMRSIQDRAGIAPQTSAFVLPLGATINMDGTALYEAVAVLFVAQLFGHDLTLAQQTAVAITALLASVGAAGIPHAGTVMMVIVLDAVGLPTDAIALILGVDRVLDMGRTTVNVWSDATAAAIIDRSFATQPPPVEAPPPEPADEPRTDSAP